MLLSVLHFIEFYHKMSVNGMKSENTKYIVYLIHSDIIAYSSISDLVHFDVIKKLTSGK